MWCYGNGEEDLQFLTFFLSLCICCWDREWEQVCGEGAERGRERENPKQALHHQCGTGCGLWLWTQEPWDGDLNGSQMLTWLSRLSQPGALGPELWSQKGQSLLVSKVKKDSRLKSSSERSATKGRNSLRPGKAILRVSDSYLPVMIPVRKLASKRLNPVKGLAPKLKTKHMGIKATRS